MNVVRVRVEEDLNVSTIQLDTGAVVSRDSSAIQLRCVIEVKSCPRFKAVFLDLKKYREIIN